MSDGTSTDTADLVRVDVDAAGCALLTLNRPHALNALSRALMTALADAVDALAADPAVRVLILTGAGRGFCAGLDLKELGAGRASLGEGELGIAPNDPVAAIGRFAGPVIGAINGVAVTGGFELALACDVLLCSTAARFADTHARIGVASGWGLSQKLSRVVGPYRANELSLTGRWLDASEAHAWGLVNGVVPPERLLDEARAMAHEMLAAAPGMLVAYKATIRDGYALAFGDAMRLERDRARAHNAALPADAIESRREAVRRRNRGG